MSRTIVVKEYDTIICNESLSSSQGYVYLEEKYFDELEHFIKEYTSQSDQADILEFMKIGYRRGVGDTITFKSYVGIIELPSGFQIEVLPKISLGEDSNDVQTRKIFLKMLNCLKDFDGKIFSTASLNTDKMNLYEIFIRMYIQECWTLVKRGIKSDYITTEDNLTVYKGKLDVNKHIVHNIAHKERFYMVFDEYQVNRPENKLIKSTLLKLLKLSKNMDNLRELRQLLYSFEMVSESDNYERDFAKVSITRGMKEYELLIQWARVFLLNKSFTTFSGKESGRALLFPMEQVFEAFVARQLKSIFEKNGSRSIRVSSQDTGYYLFDEPRKFRLRPDIVVKNSSDKNRAVVIMDTKWKSLSKNPSANYGISQSDMYQMYAYSKKYNTSDIWLIYPVNDEVRDLPQLSFEAIKDEVKKTIVKVFFIDLANYSNSLQDFYQKVYSVSDSDSDEEDYESVVPNSLFVRKYKDNWEIAYKSSEGKIDTHQENFEPLRFKTKESAQAKLSDIANVRKREDQAVPFTKEEAEAYAERHKWKFAKTYAKSAPHEYLVKSWLSEDDQLDYERFVATMKRESVVGYFYSHKNNYLILGDHYYWFMGQYENMAIDLINRTTTDYLEFKDGAYYYKGKEIN